MKLDQYVSTENEETVKTLPAMLYNSKTQKALNRKEENSQIGDKPDSKAMSRLNFIKGITLFSFFLDFKGELLKWRLLYEWKNVFRILALADINQTGLVHKDQFVKAINKCKVFLSREDLNKIFHNYWAKQIDTSQSTENKGSLIL